MMFLFPRVLETARLFSTSAAAQFPKLKSHSGAKKRWRSIASGIFKRVRSLVLCAHPQSSQWGHWYAGEGRTQAFECQQEPCEEKRLESDGLLTWLANNKAQEAAPLRLSVD